jgi:hypothetical protein
LIGFAEEISERSFQGYGHFGDSGFYCGALLLSLDFGGIRICFGEIL